jgi:single-stranded-DNA-specific exonuclease
VAVDHGIGKGSGRSISAFDLHGALSECSDLFERFGGHRAAAGLTMKAAQLPAFVDRFDAVARARLAPDDLVPELRVDLEVPIDQVGEELEKLVRHFEPFGIGNPAPMFHARDARLACSPRKVGSDGLKLSIESARGDLDAIGWGLAPRAATFTTARTFELAFKLERDEYRGVSRLQLRVADVRHPGE